MTPEREAKYARHMAALEAEAIAAEQKRLDAVAGMIKAWPVIDAISAIHASRKRHPTEWVEVES